MNKRLRSLVPARLAIVAALFLCLTSPRPASASAAPATPTFVLTWGNFGSAPGQFNRPYGVAVDTTGNVYVAERQNNRVQKFDALGNFITQWGGAGAGNGQFNGAFGIAIDAAGYVYVTDRFGNRVQKFDGSGHYILQWGSAGSGDGQFNEPVGVAAAGGYVYVVDRLNHRVQRFDSAGNYDSQWGSVGSGNEQFGNPFALATDPAGSIYVVDTGNSRIQKFDGNGSYLTQWGGFGSGNGKLNGPGAVAADALGNIYVVDEFNSRVQKFTKDGTYLAQWGSLGDGPGQFRYDFAPAGIAVDAAGNVYVANWTNDNLIHRVQKFSGAGAALSQPAPSYLLQWGSFGSGNGQFTFIDGTAVAADAAGNVYVADPGNHRIQKFTSAGGYIAQWGSLGSGNGQFNFVVQPDSKVGPVVTADAAGNIYVADTGNSRIQKFTSAGAYIAQWGSSGNGNGQFDFRGGAAVTADAAGNIYVADPGNSRIQKFTNDGAYISQWGSYGNGNGQFDFVFGAAVTVDAAGNVYVADPGNSRIQKFTSAGVYIAKWGSPGSGNGQFEISYGAAAAVTVDAAGNVYVADPGNSRIQKFTSAGVYIAKWGSPGSGNGQFEFSNGAAVTADAAGNVYVMDASNCRIQKFVAPPQIALVSDVGGDQGRQARLRILRSSADSPGSGATITGYGIYRRVDPYPGATVARQAVEPRAGTPVGSPGALLAGWEQVGTVAASGAAEYEAVVPTVADATAGSVFFTAFFVSTMTPNPLTYYDSGTGYGYSIDNLSPPAPAPFMAAYAASATHLHWGVSPTSDFATFHLHRGLSPSFTPNVGNLLAATTDTGYVDAGPAGRYYKLTAVDFSGNQSPFALLGPGQTTAVTAIAPLALDLEPVWPDPASGRTLAVHFVLPVAAPARLELLDVAGRRVASRDVGALGAGAHTVDLADGARIRPGLYFVRLTQGTGERVRRVTELGP